MALNFLGTEAFYEHDQSALCWYADDGGEANPVPALMEYAALTAPDLHPVIQSLPSR